MKKKKIEKIKNSIVLSIKYSRLKKEISDEETKISELGEKKKFLGFGDKKIDKSKQVIDNINAVISKIEQNNNPASYSLIINEQMDNQLKLLSKQKDFDLIKYSIAVEVVMDNCFQYTDSTNTDFIEKISLMLFDDKAIIKQMGNDYLRIANRIYGTYFVNYLGSTAKLATGLISKMPLRDLVMATVFVPKKALAIAGAPAMGIGFGFVYLRLKKQANKLCKLSPGDLANKLIISLLNLLYANKHYKSEAEYNNYFKYTLAEVNRVRGIVMKEMFEQQFEVDVNKLKIQLLHNFDDYLIEQMSLIAKKK